MGGRAAPQQHGNFSTPYIQLDVGAVGLVHGSMVHAIVGPVDGDADLHAVLAAPGFQASHVAGTINVLDVVLGIVYCGVFFSLSS